LWTVAAVFDFVFGLSASPLAFEVAGIVDAVEAAACANAARGDAQAQTSASAQPVPNQLRIPAPRFCMLLAKKQKDPTGTRILIIPHCRRQCQFRSGQFQVTEVSPP
jgi:hypothetical protein